MNMYISGTGAVNTGFSAETPYLKSHSVQEKHYITCSEPDYKKHIDPKFSRRLSKIIKMGLFSACEALSEAGITMPDGIITATSLGCLNDTGKFLSSIIDDNEELSSPTAFIQSTHNTISSQIAIAMGCNGYNSTYTNRGMSFESAITDAMLQINEKPEYGFLVGSSDEITDQVISVLSDPVLSGTALYNTDMHNRQIFPYGEGAAFFYMTGKKRANSICKITSLKTVIAESEVDLTELLSSGNFVSGDDLNSVDLVLWGGADYSYSSKLSECINNADVLLYKKYCGEYLTSTSYALWLSCILMKNGRINSFIDNVKKSAVEKILIMNSCNRFISAVIVENV